MKVWIMEYGQWSDKSIFGVYASMEKAKAALPEGEREIYGDEGSEDYYKCYIKVGHMKYSEPYVIESYEVEE